MLRHFTLAILFISFTGLAFASAQDTTSSGSQSTTTNSNNCQGSNALSLACMNSIPDCYAYTRDLRKSQYGAHAICNESADDNNGKKPSLDGCLDKFNNCQMPDDSDSVTDLTPQCQHSLADDLAASRKDDRDTLKSANDAARTSEKDLSDAMSQEQKDEAGIQQQIQDAQAKLADDVQKFQQQLEDTDQNTKDQLSDLESQIQQSQSNMSQYEANRESAIESAQSSLDAAKADCADKIAAQAQSPNGFQLTSRDIYSCVQQGGLANCQCQIDRHARNDRMKILRDLNKQLRDIDVQRKREVQAMATLKIKMQRLVERADVKHRQILRQISQDEQVTQAKILALQQQLSQMQQVFQQKMAQLQRNVQVDEQAAQEAGSDYSQVDKQYSYFTKNGIYGNTNDKLDDTASQRDKILDGAYVECVTGSPTWDPKTCYDPNPPDCLRGASSLAPSGGQNKNSSNGKR